MADLPTLLRRIAADERFPHPAPGGPGIFDVRTDEGLLWSWVDGAWLLDHTDAATAGVLLALLESQGSTPTVLRHRGLIVVNFGRSPTWRDTVEGHTLGEAAARALDALWSQRWEVPHAER